MHYDQGRYRCYLAALLEMPATEASGAVACSLLIPSMEMISAENQLKIGHGAVKAKPEMIQRIPCCARRLLESWPLQKKGCTRHSPGRRDFLCGRSAETSAKTGNPEPCAPVLELGRHHSF